MTDETPAQKSKGGEGTRCTRELERDVFSRTESIYQAAL